MLAPYSQHPNQLQQHPGMQQGPQQHVQGHPGQPAPHAMQQLHPQQQAQVYAQQQHQMALAGLHHPGQAQMAQIQQQQQLLVQAQQRQRQQQQAQAQQHAMMNGMSVGVGNPGMIFQGQNNGSPQVRGGLPNGLYTGGPPGGGVPGANMAYGGGNPQMRGNVSLPPHIQQQLAQAQAQQQQQQQQQQMVAQQLAMSQVNAATAAHSQASPMSMASQPQMSMQGGLAAQQQALAAQARAQQQAQQQPQSLRGASVLKLHQFCSHLAAFETNRQVNDINHWRRFVQEFYSLSGVMRQALWNSTTRETKQFEITTQVLARYYYTLFESGVKNVQIVLENTRETVLPNQGHIVESPKASFIYWFENGCHLVASGQLKATFNPNSQMEALDFQTTEHADYVPRSIVNQLISANEDAQIKLSPGSKSLGKRPSQQRHVEIPDNLVNQYGVPDTVFRCLEIAETISQMRDLFNFSHANANLTPRLALQSFVNQQQQQQQHQQQLAHQQAQQAVMQQQAMQQQQHQQQQHAAHASAMAQGLQPQHPGGPGGPGGMQHVPNQHPVMTGGLPIGLTRSPSANEIRMGVPPSPHLSVVGVGGGPGTTPSPAQNHIQAPGLVQQHSQQGNPTSNPSSQTSTTVGSANTSPNQPNKRRRASTTSEVKQGDDSGDGSGVNGTVNNKVKQSPRVGGNKRVKTNNP